MKNITINTDAGFYPIDKIGSYSFWIVSDGLLIKGSGVFKNPCLSPVQCETMAMCNAIAMLLKANWDFNNVKNIIFNRDNIYATPNKTGKEEQKKLRSLVKLLRKKCGGVTLPKVEYRHVKAHNGTADKRSYVNDWCDKQCKEQLRNWKQNHISKNTTHV